MPGIVVRLPNDSVRSDQTGEGSRAVNGRIWRLPQMAAAAGYEHLQHLAHAR